MFFLMPKIGIYSYRFLRRRKKCRNVEMFSFSTYTLPFSLKLYKNKFLGKSKSLTMEKMACNIISNSREKDKKDRASESEDDAQWLPKC